MRNGTGNGPRKVLFVDRDGTLVEEPADEQVDAVEKVRLAPGVIPALIALRDAGYRFVMVTNQDGRGTSSFPEEDFQRAHQFVVSLFRSQGIEFDAELICPHFAEDACACRKPGTAMVDAYLRDVAIDKARSYVVGDRECDVQLAENLGLRGFKLSPNSEDGATWEGIAQQVLTAPRTAQVRRSTNETDVAVSVRLELASGDWQTRALLQQPSAKSSRTLIRDPGLGARGEGADTKVKTGIGFFDHMLEQLAKHGGFAMTLSCRGDLNVDEHHTVEDCGLALGQALDQALGDRRGIGRYGFVLPMDESEARVSVDLSGRPYLIFEGRFEREAVGGLATELVPHFFRSLAEGLRAAIHIHVTGENAHHMIESVFKAVGRSLRQAVRREGNELPTTKGVL